MYNRAIFVEKREAALDKETSTFGLCIKTNMSGFTLSAITVWRRSECRHTAPTLFSHHLFHSEIKSLKDVRITWKNLLSVM